MKAEETIVLTTSMSIEDPKKKKNTDIRFTLKTSSRVWEFEAESKELKAIWVGHLRAAIQQLKLSGPSIPTPTDSPRTSAQELPSLVRCICNATN